MKIPPFVEVWSGLKKKRFYLFKDERLCFIHVLFNACEADCHRHKGLNFSVSRGGVEASVENNSGKAGLPACRFEKGYLFWQRDLSFLTTWVANFL